MLFADNLWWKPEPGQVPEDGSVDWLWFRPDIYKLSPGSEAVSWIRFKCYPCQVEFYAECDRSTRHVNCFNCGKFMKLPKLRAL